MYCVLGIKLNLSSHSDLVEARAFGHRNNYIDIYSNSWGPLDLGFIVSGPGRLAWQALQRGAAQVRIN